MTVLVTGATGFLGSRLAARVAEQGEQVRVLIRPTSDRRRLADLPVEYAEGDITDRRSVVDALAGCDVVHHVAALYEFGTADPSRMETINVGGTENVLTAAAEAGVLAVHTSSVAALGPTGSEPADESHWHDRPPQSPYEATKRRAHELARRLIADGARIRITMPGGIYGPDDPSILGTVHGWAIRGLLPVGPPPKMKMGVVHVDDCADGQDLVARKGRDGEEYILCSQVVTFREWMETLARVADTRAPRLWIPDQLMAGLRRVSRPVLPRLGRMGRIAGDAINMAAGVHYSFSGDKARSELGWDPCSLEDGFADMVAWYRSR